MHIEPLKMQVLQEPRKRQRRTRSFVIAGVVIILPILCFIASAVLFPETSSSGDSGDVSFADFPLFGFGKNDAVELPDVLNVLVIGVDGRVGSEEKNCDAIHMIHVDFPNETVEIVNVPRGTYSYIPNQIPEEQYIANVCRYMDENTFVERVEEYVGYEADYRVLIGFSQAEGLLRVLKFDPESTLQFLRHRQTYAIGEPQRSFNQAVFLEDLIHTKLDFAANIPEPATYAVYSLIRTDMPYDVAAAALDALHNIGQDTIAVTHRTAPSWQITGAEMHVDPERVDEQMAELYSTYRSYYPNFEVTDTEPLIVGHIELDLLEAEKLVQEGEYEAAEEILNSLKDEQLWHQIDYDELRIGFMMEIAALDATILWELTKDSEQASEFTQSIIWLLELEEGQEDNIRELKNHLDELFYSGLF